MPYLLDLLYLLTPLAVVFLAMRISGGDGSELPVLILLVLALLYPAYALVVALGRRAAQRRALVQSSAPIRTVYGREAWLFWLTFPLVAVYFLLIDLLRKYVTPFFYKRPVDLVILAPRPVPAAAAATEQAR